MYVHVLPYYMYVLPILDTFRHVYVPLFVYTWPLDLMTLHVSIQLCITKYVST